MSEISLIELTLWIITAIIFGIFAFVFIKRAYTKEDVSKSFNLAAGILFVGLGMRFIMGLFATGEDKFIMFLSNSFLFIAVLPLGIYLERLFFRKSKNFLSLLSIILFVINVIISIGSNFTGSIMFVWVIPPFLVELIILLWGYIQLIRKSTGIVRKSAIFIFIGCILIIFFGFVHGVIGPGGQIQIPGIAEIVGITFPIIIILGALIAAKGFFGYS